MTAVETANAKLTEQHLALMMQYTVEAYKTFEKLAENKMPDQIAASPSIAGGRIYIRGFKELYAISEGGR